jgi:hypothetical protein
VLAEVFLGGELARALRTGNTKIVHAVSRDREHIALYDLAQDPDEMNDLSTELPDLTEAMFARLTRMRKAAAEKRVASETEALDPETTEKLRALGYIE